jgi:hypothetical protein
MNRAPLRLRPLAPTILGAAALAAASFAAPEPARAFCSVLSRHPCTPYFGSVLRRHPFTPYSCGVSGGPCSPEVVLLSGKAPVLKVAGHAGPPGPIDRDHPLDRLDEVALLFSKCLELPPDGQSQAGMELALRFAFKRNGEIVADPRFTYTTRGASENVKGAWRAAALDMLQRCTPVPMSANLGGAIAGQPIVVAIRETREIKAGGDAAAAPPGDSRP